MKLTEFAITIGMAGLAVLTAAITMAVAKMLYSSWTAEGRVQTLHDLFRAVSDRHQFLVNELLPKLDQHRYEFSIVENAKRVTDVLLGYDHSLPSLTLQYLPYTVKGHGIIV